MAAENSMRSMIILIALLTALVGCAGTYKPPESGSTVKLRVEVDAKQGIPILSSTSVSLHVGQLTNEKYEHSGKFQRKHLWWQKIDLEEVDKNQFVIPADRPLDVTLYYDSQILSRSLTGNQSYVFMPEEGKSYLLKFWTDKKSFSVKAYEETSDGTLRPIEKIADGRNI